MKKRNLYDSQGNCINCEKTHESVNKKFREYKQQINLINNKPRCESLRGERI